MEDASERTVHSLILFFHSLLDWGQRYDLVEKNTLLQCNCLTVLSLIQFHYSPLNSCSRCVLNGK